MQGRSESLKTTKNIPNDHKHDMTLFAECFNFS